MDGAEQLWVKNNTRGVNRLIDKALEVSKAIALIAFC